MTELLSTTQNCPDLCEDPANKLPCVSYLKGGFCTKPNYFRCLEYVSRNEPNLSYTAISDYSACHRKFWWSWMVGIEGIDKPWAMQLGLFASTILGWLHDFRVPTETAVQRYQMYIDRLIAQTIDPEDSEKAEGNPDLWKMKAMFDSYIELGYPQNEKGIPEYGFRWNFDGQPKIKGFIDLLNKQNPEEYHGWEYKYTGNADNFSKYLIEDQLITYLLAEPKIMTMTNRCFLYPTIWKRTKKNPETCYAFYDRCKAEILHDPKGHFYDRKYWRHEFDYDNYFLKTKRVCDEIMNYIKEGKGMEPFYQNKKNCFNPWQCDFLRICEHSIKEPWLMTEAYKQRKAKPTT